MEDTEKPFACTVEGCTMKFTNEDHLTVHKKKHDMVLNLGSGKTNVFIADQTPTPTRFIRNCEEVGLFQDLQNVNPFEETFRKAVEASRSGEDLEVDTLHVSLPADDSLHTPHVFPSIIDEHTRAHTPIAGLISAASAPGPGGGDGGRGKGKDKSPDRQPLSALLAADGSADGPAHDLPLSAGRQQAGASQHMLAGSADSAAPPSAPAPSSLPASRPSQPQPQSGDAVQLLVRMPDGRLVQLSGVSMSSGPAAETPVQVSAAAPPVLMVAGTGSLPVVAAASSSGIPASAAAPAPDTGLAQTAQQARLSLAKMKLKQQLTSSKRKQPEKPETEPSSSSPPKKLPLPRAAPLPAAEPAEASPACDSGAASVEDDCMNKQRKRERNRAAAIRCREKRKHWILELERHAKDTQLANQSLSCEVATLRAELAQLKALLLAHRDCPVTRAMQQQGFSLPPARSTPGTSGSASKPSVAAKPAPPVPIITLSPCAEPPPQPQPPPKLVLLSKPSSLKRRRLGRTAQQSTSGEPGGAAGALEIATQEVVVPDVMVPEVIMNDDADRVTDSPRAGAVDQPDVPGNSDSGQACVVSLRSDGNTRDLAATALDLSTAGYILPAQLCLSTADATAATAQVIKLNPNIRAAQRDAARAGSGSNSSAMSETSTDSGNGSDIDILVEIPSRADGRR